MNRTAIVVGGGIGGLAAAIGLHRIGWTALVLEQAPKFDAVGAGISLWPNALRALDALGIGDDVRALDAPGGIESGVRSAGGRWLKRTGLPIVMLHRADLHSALVSAVPPEWLVPGAEVQQVTADGEVTWTAAGAPHTERADLVIGADGLRSVTRTQLWPDAAAPEFVGRTAWRGVTRPGGVILDAEGETMGLGGRFGILQLRDERVYWFAESRADRPDIRYPEPLEELRRRHGSWHDPIPRLLDATDPQAVLHHDLYHLPALPTYVRERVVLIGDAAHAMTPDLGQGACQALEDVVELVARLATGDVPAALAGYDAARKPRTRQMARASRRMGNIGLARTPAGLWAKSVLSVLTPGWLIAWGMQRVSAWDAPPVPIGRPD
ncbi:MAG TPA: FAD-dependent monooxygenase [Mycobacteriales bacterium]|nr:FAD-dependent monooxygenase [Mycobacteriales bacterium]